MPRPCELWMMLVENNTVLNISIGAAKTECSAAAALRQQQQIGHCYTGEKRPRAPMAQADFMGQKPVVCIAAGCSRTGPVFFKIDVREALFLFSSHKQEGQKWIGIKSIKAASVMKPGTETGNWKAAQEFWIGAISRLTLANWGQIVCSLFRLVIFFGEIWGSGEKKY